MKIQFLGTAAYDVIPSLFCKCDTCMRARKLRGRNIRSRSQALVNDDLLLDFNPDTVMHFQRFEIDPNKITTCLITHSHEDHLYGRSRRDHVQYDVRTQRSECNDRCIA